MTEQSIELIDKRRNLTIISGTIDQNETMKKTLDKEIKKACRNDKNDQIMRINIQKELEAHANNNRTHQLNDKVRYVPREFRPRTQIIKNENYEVITVKNYTKITLGQLKQKAKIM